MMVGAITVKADSPAGVHGVVLSWPHSVPSTTYAEQCPHEEVGCVGGHEAGDQGERGPDYLV